VDGLVKKTTRVGRRKAAPLEVALVNVYRLPAAAPQLLYQLLQERKPQVNISHRAMPTWKQHLRFIASRPYSAWYLIRTGNEYVGAIYLTALGEIGIGILEGWQGAPIGPAAIRALMVKHPRERFLANINPRNTAWLRMFRQLDFRLLQRTYELRTSGARR
jgi:hypothetical protein